MKWLDRFLKSIADANQRQFGSTPPSCCRHKEEKRPDANEHEYRKGDNP